MRFFITLFQANMAQDIGPTRLIETKNIPEETRPFGLQYAENRAYFCKGCGRVWAKWQKDQEDFVGDNWYAYHRTCPDHQFGGYTGDTPGSMILYKEDIVVLPRVVLENELMLITKGESDVTETARF